MRRNRPMICRSTDVESRRAGMRIGFTLVELLVVIGIISVLIAILLPALRKARDAARQTVCLSNLRQLGAVAFLYANDNKGYFPTRPPNAPWPPQVPYWPGYSSTDADTRELWLNYLTGYTIEQTSPVFYCPFNDDPSLYNSYAGAWNNLLGGVYLFGYSYFGAYQNLGVWVGSVPPAQKVGDLPDTSLFGDITESYLDTNGEPWSYAAHTKVGGVQWLPPGSPIHPDGMNCVLSDGSARWFGISVDSSNRVTPNSEVEPCVRVSAPGFYWGKPDIQ